MKNGVERNPTPQDTIFLEEMTALWKRRKAVRVVSRLRKGLWEGGLAVLLAPVVSTLFCLSHWGPRAAFFSITALKQRTKEPRTGGQVLSGKSH